MVLHLQGRLDSVSTRIVAQNGGNLALLHIQIRLPFTNPLETELVSFLVTLSARRPHRRPSFGVEHPKLQARHIRGFSHLPAKSVNFPRQVTLCETANGRIAGHLADGVRVDRQQQSRAAHARRRQGGLDTGVPAPNHDHIILFRINKHHRQVEGKRKPPASQPRNLPRETGNRKEPVCQAHY